MSYLDSYRMRDAILDALLAFKRKCEAEASLAKVQEDLAESQTILANREIRKGSE